MLTEIMGKNSVLRLKGILADRYGMGLTLTSMISATDVDVNHMKNEVREGILHVPICVHGKYLATAMMNRAEALTNDEITAISDLVRLVLEPALFSMFLERQETNIGEASQKIAKSENVVELRSSPRRANTLANWDHTRPEFSTPMILLESAHPHTISRVALHIHEIGDRWALVRYTELRSHLQTMRDLTELGPMTLVIDDILMLSMQEQSILAEYSHEADPNSEPLILIGSTSPLAELGERQTIHQELLQVLLPSRLELDRLPKDFSQLRQAVDLFLDRKALLI